MAIFLPPPFPSSLLQYLDSDYGMYTWPCASVLAQYVYSQREAIRGKQVLEVTHYWCVSGYFIGIILQLGAGTAVPGIVAAKCGAKVTLTDSSTNQVLLDNLSRTCQLNEVSDVRVMGLSWGVFSPSLLSLEPQDFILASDCFYESRGSCYDKCVCVVYYITQCVCSTTG